MKLKDIRKRFLTFFEERGHKIYESAPLIPEDKTVLFTIAGMVPFKDFFLGKKVAPVDRATSSQVCIRTSDIDIIGQSPRHLTTFEMLGNFSFGDYFKKEAIAFGWELITKELGVDPNKLIVTVYKEDEEALSFWKEHIPSNQIYKLGKDTNFWEVGEQGPCGPCSEIYYAFDGVENFDPDSDRFIEVYNMVFMSLNRDGDKFTELPKKNIDTGMGLERIALVLQGVDSIFKIDAYRSVISKIRELSGKKIERAENIIADHIKSAAFLINDDLVPSNEKQGYVLRRLIRRAVKYGYELGISNFLTTILKELVKEYDVLDYNKIAPILEDEEKRFSLLLDRGIEYLDDYLKNSELDADFVFKLYDTYGFPFELTKEIAESKGIKISEEEFNRKFKEHQELSRANAKFGNDKVSEEKYLDILKSKGETGFLGYDNLSSEGTLLDIEKDGDFLKMIFDRTPFYAEAGGQIGDRGYIENNSFKGEVIDVQKTAGIYVHKVKAEKGEAKLNENFNLYVDKSFRDKVAANHTATHLLHEAAKKVLKSAKQAGSLVTDERLRLDITTPKAITKEELIEIETLVNREIIQNHEVCLNISTLEEAKSKGVTAHFEDRYGDSVRVVSIGDFSAELCGGTHTCATGKVGLFKIVSEKGIAANIRRVEAVTGLKALEQFRKMEEDIDNISSILKTQKETILDKIEKLTKERQSLSSELGIAKKKLLKSEVENINFSDINGVRVGKIELSSDLLNLLTGIKVDNSVIVAYSKEGNLLILSNSTIKLSSLKDKLPSMGIRGGGNDKMIRAKFDRDDSVDNLLKEIASV